MNRTNYVAYYRVSTQKQGRSGLGLDAQRSSVAAYLHAVDRPALAEFTEVETGKGSNALDRRPELAAALSLCRRQGATLVIAKLDRLARNVHFVSGLIESGVEFVAADMPQASKTMIQIYAAMSEWERDAISQRTKDALAAARARGVKLGLTGPANLRPVIASRQAEADAYAEKLRPVLTSYRGRGFSQRAIASALNDLGIKSPRGEKWHLITVQRVLQRLLARDSSALRAG